MNRTPHEFNRLNRTPHEFNRLNRTPHEVNRLNRTSHEFNRLNRIARLVPNAPAGIGRLATSRFWRADRSSTGSGQTVPARETTPVDAR